MMRICCIHCGKEFFRGTSVHKTTCSNACKKRAQRKREKERVIK